MDFFYKIVNSLKKKEERVKKILFCIVFKSFSFFVLFILICTTEMNGILKTKDLPKDTCFCFYWGLMKAAGRHSLLFKVTSN